MFSLLCLIIVWLSLPFFSDSGYAHFEKLLVPAFAYSYEVVTFEDRLFLSILLVSRVYGNMKRFSFSSQLCLFGPSLASSVVLVLSYIHILLLLIAVWMYRPPKQAFDFIWRGCLLWPQKLWSLARSLLQFFKPTCFLRILSCAF